MPVKMTRKEVLKMLRHLNYILDSSFRGDEQHQEERSIWLELFSWQELLDWRKVFITKKVIFEIEIEKKYAKRILITDTM